MFIRGLGTAVPPFRYSQLQCWDAIQQSAQFPQLKRRSKLLLEKVLTGRNGISTRCFALPDLSQVFQLEPDALHERFAKNAVELSVNAGLKALANAEIAAEQIDGLVISTCTGYLCPGLTSYVAEKLGLRRDVIGLDLVGHGCGATLPNWRAAKSLLDGECENVLCISVEVCSAALYLDDDPGVLISACLFSDGAGAAVMSREQTHPRKLALSKFVSYSVPEDRDYLRFEQRNGMLRNILHQEVPGKAAAHVRKLTNETINKPDISGWVFHAGGREVLAAVARELDLNKEDLEISARILDEYGNLSSPFVYFVLERSLASKVPPGLWWVCSFGAGFTAHGALLEVS